MRRRIHSPRYIPGTPASFAPRCLPAAHWRTRTHCGTFWSGRHSGPLPSRPLRPEKSGVGVCGAFWTPFAAAGLFLIMIPELIVQSLFYREIPGTLEGFAELNGLHYPRYSFSLPDGTLQRRTDPPGLPGGFGAPGRSGPHPAPEVSPAGEGASVQTERGEKPVRVSVKLFVPEHCCRRLSGHPTGTGHGAGHRIWMLSVRKERRVFI